MSTDAQEQLLERGWLELVGEDKVAATAAGRYWLARYRRDQERKARKAAV